eukprot:292297-Prymnesium_polylepis.1
MWISYGSQYALYLRTNLRKAAKKAVVTVVSLAGFCAYRTAVYLRDNVGELVRLGTMVAESIYWFLSLPSRDIV